MNHKTIIHHLKGFLSCLIIISSLLSLPLLLWAGDLDSPAAVNHTDSNMYTISDIYNRLETGEAGTKGSFAEPTSGPGSTGKTLNEVMGIAPAVDNTNGVSPAEVPSGKTYWGLKEGSNTWGLKTGTGDDVVDTSTGDAAASDIKIDKKAWVDGSEVTGALAGGTYVNPAATCSPLGRWCDNGNGTGTITDTTTGLIWYHKGNAIWGPHPQCGANISNMSHLSPVDLTDGSSGYDWRMPTVNEMLHLTSGVEAISPTSQYRFTGITTAWYWTSSYSTNPVPPKALIVQMPESNGYGTATLITNDCYNVSPPCTPMDPLHYSMAVRNP